MNCCEELIPAPLAGTSCDEHEDSRKQCRLYRLSGSGGDAILIDFGGDASLFNRYMTLSVALRSQRICTPQIYAQNRRKRQLLAKNFSEDPPLMNGLKSDTAERYLYSCLSVLDRLQSVQVSEQWSLPTKDKAQLLNDMNLFAEWYLPLKGVRLNETETIHLADMFTTIAEYVSRQPYCFAHNRFRRAQLVPKKKGGVMVTGFERACLAPICWDLATLLMDRRLGLPRAVAERAIGAFFQHSAKRRFEYEMCSGGARDFARLADYTSLVVCLKRMGEVARGLLQKGVRSPPATDPTWAELVWLKKNLGLLASSWHQIATHAEHFKMKFHTL